MKISKQIIISIILFIISGLLVAMTMPPFFNIPFLGFVALVPAILSARKFAPPKYMLIIIVFYGLVYSVISYSWYVDIFSGIMGYFLIVAVAAWHAGLIRNGLLLEKKCNNEALQVFALPVVYAILEYAQRNIPVIKQWWFIPYPKTTWGSPENLWLLSITGITGLTFMMILANSSIAKIIQNKLEKKKNSKMLYASLLLVIVYLIAGFYATNSIDNLNTRKIAVVSDMANDISGSENEGAYVTDLNISNKILAENLELSKKHANKADFIVWSENEFFDFDNDKTINQLKEFAKASNSNLIVDAYIKRNDLYDSAVLISSKGESPRYAQKTYLFSAEKEAGFVARAEELKVFEVNGLKLGLGVCYDYHFTDIVRKLAQLNADIIIMPTDDDMRRNQYFPYYHATDAVFRAIENNVSFASANTNGASIIVNRNGKIIALSEINKVSSEIGEVTINSDKTFYTKYGDWFVYILLLIFIVILEYSFKRQTKE